MNEDARDEDTVTGRALGTVAVLGLSALGLGLGAHMTAKAVEKGAGAVKNGVTTTVHKVVNKKTTNELRNKAKTEGLNAIESFNKDGIPKLKVASNKNASAALWDSIKSSDDNTAYKTFKSKRKDGTIKEAPPFKKSVRKKRAIDAANLEKNRIKNAVETFNENNEELLETLYGGKTYGDKPSLHFKDENAHRYYGKDISDAEFEQKLKNAKEKQQNNKN